MMSEEEDGERRMLGEEEQRLFNDPLPVVSDSVLGKRKQLTRLNSWEWSFAAISVVNVVACIVLSAIRLAEVINERKHSPDFTFTMLLIINSAFCLFYVVHGLLKELQYEIYVLILAILVVLVYCIIEYTVNTEGHSRIKEARLIVVCITAPVNIILACKVAYDFGWLEFRILGAASDMLMMYRQVCWFFSLIKFDLQVAISFLVLILKNGQDAVGLEIILVLSIGLSVSVIWSIFGALLVKRESKMFAWIFSLVGLAAPAFVIFKIIRAFQKYMFHEYAMVLYSTLLIGALLILIRILVYFELILAYRNFGKGLRRRAFEEVTERSGLLSKSRR